MTRSRLAAALLLAPVLALADAPAPHPLVLEGNQALDLKDFQKALSRYSEAARDLPGDPDLAFNRGGALYASGSFAEAARAFLDATASPDPQRRAEAYRHYGDAQLQLQQLDAAIEAYQRALVLHPEDAAARHNLEVALQRRQQTPPPQSQPQEPPPQQPPSAPQSQPQSQPGQDGQPPQPQDGQDGQPQAPQPGQDGQQNQPQDGQQGQPQGNQGGQPKDGPPSPQDPPPSGSPGQEGQPKDGQPAPSTPKPTPGQEGQPKDGQAQPSAQGAQGQPKEGQAGQAGQAQDGQGKPAEIKAVKPSQALLDALRAKEKSFVHEQRKRQQPAAPRTEKDW